jgi:phosphate transport system protein
MRLLDEDLRQLRVKISNMAQAATRMFVYSIDALIRKDLDLAQKVKDLDDEVDALDNDIDEFCANLIALRWPLAEDLRIVLSALKINTFLERIADNATNIAEWIEKIDFVEFKVDTSEISNMKDKTVIMLETALDSFFSKDYSKAITVIKSDDYVDKCELSIIKEMAQMTNEQNASILTIPMIFIARAIERIADEATNIAELSLYIATGEIFKHKRIKDL